LQKTKLIVEIKTCRHCGSQNITKNGYCKATQKQKFHCNDCNKYGTLELNGGTSSQGKKEILDAYFDRPSMGGLARIFHISRNTLRDWLVEQGEKYADLTDTLHDVPTSGDVLEYDELQHFVKKKRKKMAMDCHKP
jgi:transposase-like protein